jgi:hypothetical protein
MFNTRRIVAIFSALAAASTLSLVTAQASSAAPITGAFHLMNPASGNFGCVQANAEKDIQLTTAICGNNDFQQWIFDPVGTNLYHIRNAHTGWCMRVRSGADFSPVETIDCTNISDENFFIPNLGNTLSPPFTIISALRGGGSPCLDLKGGATTTDIRPVDVFHCTSNNAAQLFTL